MITDAELEDACAPLHEPLTQLIHEAVTDAENESVRAVRCIGGGTILKPLVRAVESTLPGREIRQMNPDNVICKGGCLDCAQATNRLPATSHRTVTAVAPYSIGIGFAGDVVGFVIYRGEPLPVPGAKCLETVLDSQHVMNCWIFQGKHLLGELGEEIGTIHYHEREDGIH
jgi:molecular chaperone DnaK (HSP70)